MAYASRHIPSAPDKLYGTKFSSYYLPEFFKTDNNWTSLMNLYDPKTRVHCERVVDLAVKIAEECGLNDKDINGLMIGAYLHDIGKVKIPRYILEKKERLNDDEFNTMKMHTTFGWGMLSGLSGLEDSLDIPHYHHERWDGNGYPCKLKGEEIPISVRIFSLADVYDALTNERSYKSAWSDSAATSYIRSQAGKQFDPRIVDVFLRVVDHK